MSSPLALLADHDKIFVKQTRRGCLQELMGCEATTHRRHMFWAAVQAALYRSTASMVFRDHGAD